MDTAIITISNTTAAQLAAVLSQLPPDTPLDQVVLTISLPPPDDVQAEAATSGTGVRHEPTNS